MSTRTRLSVVATAIIVVLLMSTVPAFAKNKSGHDGCSTGKADTVVTKGHTKGDRDGDGLKNIDEFRCGTSPRRADTDKDGVCDGLEDPDGDGLVNIAEIKSKTHPRRADTDRDGVNDSLEDPDKDGLTNGQEYLCGTNPRRADTDKDGIKDADEDADCDGLGNGAEFTRGCDPKDSDSDDDGVLDGNEDVAAEPAPEVIGTMQADGTVTMGDAGSAPEGDAAIARVDWYLAPEGRAGLMATGANFDYEVLIDAGTKFSWAPSVNTDHEPSAADLTEGAVVTALDITYTADGELLAKKIVLIPSYLAGAAD